MKYWKRTWTILGLLMLIPIVVYVIHNQTMRNPFDNVIWVKDYPGATDRYVEYTPVLKSDKNIQIGPTVGADFASLRFRDLDNDGVKEAILETERLIDFGEFTSPERHVLKKQIDNNGNPQFILLGNEMIDKSGVENK